MAGGIGYQRPGIVHGVIRTLRFVGDHGQLGRFREREQSAAWSVVERIRFPCMAGIWLSRRLRFRRGVRVGLA